MKRFIFYAPIAAFLALAFVLWRGLYLDPTELPSVLIDKPMPAFAMTTVEGEPVDNADLPGRIFLLNVWGSYCLPCLVEHPTLMRLSGRRRVSRGRRQLPRSPAAGARLA